MSEPLDGVARYYGEKVLAHGPTPRGVDWRDQESQRVRFAQLLRIAERAPTLEILDYGCGYGALVDELERDGRSFSYIGYDIAPEMVAEARRLHPDLEFTTERDALVPTEYVVASGILNVKLDAPDEEWREHVLAAVADLDALSSRGFAFNALTSYSEPEKMRDDLYYPDPRELFDLCKRSYSRHVALLHDYGLWEFTLLVRKDV
jgi:SAM-dependent methyltransferase